MSFLFFHNFLFAIFQCFLLAFILKNLSWRFQMSYSFPISVKKTTAALYLIALASFFCMDIQGSYIERFSTIDNGGIAFTGNSVGLSKSAGDNNPGTNDSIGAFISTDSNLQVNNFPAGTTLDIASNSSAAVLDLPSGSDVLYAELIWSGSYGWPLENPLPAPADDCQVTLTTPQMITHTIKADKSTAQNDLSPGFQYSGNYVRSANVTGIVQLGGKGTYIAGKIPGTIDKTDEEHNAAGWTLAVVYRNPKMYTSRLILWTGCEQGHQSKEFHTVESFFAPRSGAKTARLFISAIEGDAIRAGDHLLFGSHPNLVFPDNALSGPNNPIDNFFASQINTLIEFSVDSNGKWVPSGSAQLDTRGTFGLQNQDAINRQNNVGARQGYDITSIDVSDKIDYEQTTVYIQGQTLEEDEDYTIGALGLQVQVDAPVITGTCRIDGQSELVWPAADNQSLSFTLTIENCGTHNAEKVVLKNLLQKGLNFISGSIKINGESMPDRYVDLVPLGSLNVNQSAIIEYQAVADKAVLESRTNLKGAKISYQYAPFDQEQPLTLTAQTTAIPISR